MSSNKPKRGRRAVSLSELRQTYSEVEKRERLSVAAKAFCEGETPSQIQKRLSERFGGEIRREEPYRLLQFGGASGYFHYRPPLEVDLGDRLLDGHNVREAHVVLTRVLDDVTARAADVLLTLIREEWAAKRESHEKTGVPDEDEADTVRVGLAGGRTVLLIVRALVELLKRADPDTVPSTLWFHTACTGIHGHDSSTDPNAFVSHLLRVPGIDTHIRAVPYQAPLVTRPELRAMLDKEPLMREARKLFQLVDILVTGGSSWRIKEVSDTGVIQPPQVIERREHSTDGDPSSHIHSQLEDRMKGYDKHGYNQLVRAGTVVDMLWQPLAFEGPVEIDTKVKAMTLAPLSELPEFIERGKKVLLVLGPYFAGIFHKGDVLLACLGDLAPADGRLGPLFTHLVCDHRTARAAVKACKP